MEYRIIIAGSRNFDDYKHLKYILDGYFERHIEDDDKVTIISGSEFGAAKLGEKYALENGIHLVKYSPTLKRSGKMTNQLKNEEKAKLSNQEGCVGVLIAFWDGICKDTEHMIDIAKEHGLKTYVIKVRI